LLLSLSHSKTYLAAEEEDSNRQAQLFFFYFFNRNFLSVNADSKQQYSF
jgi:hypothetical protein